MLRCSNCNGPVDVNAVACPRCGRPEAGAEAARLQSGGCLAIFLAILGLGVYAKFFSESDPAQTEQTAFVESAQSSVASNGQPSIDGSSQFEPNETGLPQEEPESNLGINESPNLQEETEADLDANQSPNLQGDFLLDATLTDKRGEIVLQSKASIFSKNVSVLASGTPVRAEPTSGEWIRILTSDGLVGYVRRKQLVFSDQSQL